MTPPNASFFLDSNIVLSEILKQNNPRINKMKNDSQKKRVFCYISSSIQKEVYDKVQATSNYLGNSIRGIIKQSLEDSRKNNGLDLTLPLTKDDIRVLEDLFSGFHNAIRKNNSSLQSPISAIEEWAITYLAEKIEQGITVTINDFVLQLTMRLLVTTSEIENSYDDLVQFQNSFIVIKQISPDQKYVTDFNRLGLHKPDDLHVASAYSYQEKNKENVVFVTFDYKTILRKRYALWNAGYLIKCSDPLYAIHHIF